MNRVFTSIIMALGLISSAAAQTSSSISQHQEPTEVIELSAYTDGNYLVEQQLVMESAPSNNEFAVRYKINVSKLISSYGDNTTEIAGLRNFVESVQSDSLKRISSFDIVGYASPDGAATLNKRIASERAQDFCNFVDTQCNMADYQRTVSSKPLMWVDAKSAIESSSVPNKSEVISIISEVMPQSQIEMELKKHDAAWEYIKENILPPMRYVEIVIHYNSWKLVESRTLIEAVEPQTEVVGVVGVAAVAGSGTDCTDNGRRDKRRARKEECCEEPADDYIYCMLVEMPGQEIDFGDCVGREKLKVRKNGLKYKELTDDEKIKIKEREGRKSWN